MAATAEMEARFDTDLRRANIMRVGERVWVSNGVEIQKIDWRDLQGIDQIVDLQDKVWRMGDRNLVPSNLLAVVEETGGDLLGAFDNTGEAQGFVLTLATSDPKKMFLHMVGVPEQKQSKNIGKQLMLLEGAIARSKGIERIDWTYDPLMCGNAKLYVGTLGAQPFKYTVNKYGIVENKNAGTESRYKSVETDRFTASWNIGNDKIWDMALSQKTFDPEQLNLAKNSVWNGEGEAPDTFSVPVVYDFTKITTDEMMDERMALRKVALKTMDTEDIQNRQLKTGTHTVTGFVADPDKNRNFYFFSKKTS